MSGLPGPLVPLVPDAGAIALAVSALKSGSVVAVPTDTVYGLAVDPTNPAAVEQLFSLKRRPADVALPVLVAGSGHVAQVAGTLDSAAHHLAERHWPGPLTLVVPRQRSFTVDLGGPRSSRSTVGVRWPDHDLVRELCQSLGPLAVTSANLHGSRPATSAQQVAQTFAGADALAVVLDGGRCDGVPSTVVECRGPAFRCLREGAIPWA
ncbi:MAG TPA: L-threonylcarbamoyladenylate synthase, partial [Acidimicrobiales bacterium]|nr:L-threonylcarbamoyladenylate synthase [Acidimicrobiales bacterium]